MTTQKFPKLKFQADTAPYCCGHLEVAGIEAHHHEFDYYAKPPANRKDISFPSVEASFKDFLDSVNKRIEDDTENWNEEEDTGQDFCYAFVSLTLYRGQHLYDGRDLIDYLIENGYKILMEGVNPKTGNTIINLGMTL